MVYKEDRPTEVCDKHVAVDYCITGGGVANEYCKNLAHAGEPVKLGTQSLLKMTQQEMLEILQAKNYGLDAQFVRDDYEYLVDGSGNDADFNGFSNKINGGINAPYKVCTAHTKADWDKYQTEHAPKPPEPTTPEEPENPTDPTVPETPTQPTEPPQNGTTPDPTNP